MSVGGRAGGAEAVRLPVLEECSSVTHPERFAVDWAQFYAEGLAARGAAHARHVNARYGAHPYELLDIHGAPGADTRRAPVLLFFHGGAFREGHPAFYSQLAAPWVAAGIVFVNCGYRLAPETLYPEQLQEAAAAVSWVFHNISRYGGDRQRISVAGHSVGATLAAALGTTSGWRRALGLPTDVIRSVVAVSGLYDFRRDTFNVAVDDGRREEASLVRHVESNHCPILLAHGTEERNLVGGDPRIFADSAVALLKALRERPGWARELALDRLDHVETARALSDGPLFRAALRLVNGAERVS